MHEHGGHHEYQGDECGCGGEGHGPRRGQGHGPMHGPGGHHGHHGGECECGCGGEGRGFHRRFATREERIAHLQEYLNELRAEAQAVEEHIAELRAAG